MQPLAGLLIAELVLDGTLDPAGDGGRLVRARGHEPSHELLAAVASVIDLKGPSAKAVLRGMDRGLRRELGRGTWDAVLTGLIASGVLGPSRGRLLAVYPLLQPQVRQRIVGSLHAAAAGDGALGLRTAMLLSMTGPAHLLKQVAPDRTRRTHARRRIDHCLEDTELSKVGDLVRRVLAEAQSAAAAGAMVAVIASTG